MDHWGYSRGGEREKQAFPGRILYSGEERNVHAIFIHERRSAAKPQPKCLNFEEVNHKDTKARRETLDL
uniref:Uncharacterized protein n=2 Tax=Candidatus Kentrum sp. FM TaxID=2126340 RepID=A0A450TBB3_9GAMM|nr:MAG: hypothetical protein BECKFM1743A_GA0114220_103471 [Candidatus Kentron sp. FM]